MSRYHFELAGRADDPVLRRFLAASVMPGPLQLSFRREPDFFAPGATFGPFHQTMVCRDAEREEIVGLGSRSIATLHVDGAPTPVGYLSMLRSADHVRNGLLLARGYRFLRELHGDGRAPYYLTTIAEGNDVALDILTSGRASLPRYAPAGRYHTFAIATSKAAAADDVESIDDLKGVIGFLDAHAKSRQFFPRYQLEDFDGPEANFAGIGDGDVFVHRNDCGQVGATMALWDQRSSRQTVIAGYEGALRRLRPLYNAAAPLHRRPRLPDPGQRLDYGYVAIPAIDGDDPAVFAALLDTVLARARDRGLPMVLFGCHQHDPLRPEAKRRSFLTYTTRVFAVSWDDDVAADAARLAADPALPIYLELGCL